MARVTGAAMVSSVNKINNSFVMNISQTIALCDEGKPSFVRAVLEKGPKWPRPTERLPSAHSFVSFTGKLSSFEKPSPHDIAQTHSRFVVALDSITYLRSNPNTMQESPVLTPLQAKSDDLDLKQRVQKYARIDISEGETSKSASR